MEKKFSLQNCILSRLLNFTKISTYRGNNFKKYIGDLHYSWILCLCFAYSLTFMYNTKINSCGTFMVIFVHVKSGKIFELSNGMFPVYLEQECYGLPSCFSSYYNQVPFSWSLWCHAFFILCFLFMISLFKMAPQV